MNPNMRAVWDALDQLDSLDGPRRVSDTGRLAYLLRPAPMPRSPLICQLEGCDTWVHARGLCGRHYQQAWRSNNLPLIEPEGAR